MNEKYWVAFSSMEQLESTFIQRLYNYFGDIKTAWEADISALEQIDELSKRKAETFLKNRDKINPDKALDLVLSRGIKFLTFEDDKYPYLLKNIFNPPILLYYKGELDNCNFEKTLAVVGSRRARLNAKSELTKIIAQLANTDITIVSGLASGIDTIAHTAALNNGLKTIGVIASGFDFTYPSSNKYLYKRIEDGNGVIFTEYYPTFEPLKFRFPQRNRIVSELSSGTLVAEAALKSGALITANLTLEQGRELMCMPGLISNPNTEGIYKLLKNSATMTTNAEDILNALNWEIKTNISNKSNENLSINDDEKIILKALEIEEKGFDEIQTNTKISTQDLLTLLTILELKGIIEQVLGDKYKKI